MYIPVYIINKAVSLLLSLPGTRIELLCLLLAYQSVANGETNAELLSILKLKLPVFFFFLIVTTVTIKRKATEDIEIPSKHR